jgi:cystathionine gamma-synthase
VTRSGQTLAAQALGRVAEPYKDLAPPVHVSSTYERAADLSYPGGRVYARDQNPTYDTAEQLLAALEGGSEALLFASGNAAAVAVFQSLGAGSTILAPRRMYWALRKWLTDVAPQRGLRPVFYENASAGDLAVQAEAHRPALIWVETPANPTWEITDIAAAASVARGVGARLAVDSTVATPVFTQPLTLGADWVMHSATKALNGHSDVVAGAVVTREVDDAWQRIRYQRAGGGAVLGPFEAWLLLRGMRTLHLRARASAASALALAEALRGHPRVEQVLYPGLSTHPGHAIAQAQMQGGFGGLLSVCLAGGEAAAVGFTARLKVFKRATSLGSVESLAEHRASVEGPQSLCPRNLVRLSVGIEALDDLCADLLQALEGR